ncbi:hypothetical protein RHIZO_00493 [Rhizobiaceae bacterium]|nr:hypothetical protein RHIZO_00493 [Rhizobiaceae bacterium]
MRHWTPPVRAGDATEDIEAPAACGLINPSARQYLGEVGRRLRTLRQAAQLSQRGNACRFVDRLPRLH